MNKFLKIGILLLTLAIPIFIWLFLKNFGQNQFALPAYYQDSTPSIEGCQNLESPHDVSMILAQNTKIITGANIEEGVGVSYSLPEICGDDCRLVLENLANLQTLFYDNPDFQILLFASSATYTQQQLNALKDQYLANPNNWKFVLMESSSFRHLQRCGFLLPAVDLAHPLVMTDEAGVIRGYYEGYDQEEIDRLKGELKILFYMQETTIYD